MPFAVAQSKSEELHLEGTDLEKERQRKLRGHPLFFGITMGLLAEVINSRYLFLHNCPFLLKLMFMYQNNIRLEYGLWNFCFPLDFLSSLIYIKCDNIASELHSRSISCDGCRYFSSTFCLSGFSSFHYWKKCSMQSYVFCVIPDGMAEIYPTSHQTSIITP